MRRPGEVTAPLWNRLGRFNPLQRRVLVTHLIFLVLTGAVYETFQTTNFTDLFLFAIPLSTLSYFLVFIPLQLIALRIPAGFWKGLATASFTMVAYLAHSLLLLYLVEPAGFVDLALHRLPGDITAAVTFYWMMVAIVSTGIDDLSGAADLVATSRRELEVQRSRRLRAAKEFDSQLRERIESTLLGELQSIRQALQDSSGKPDSAGLSRHIHELVEGKVRPLSKELVTRSESVAIPKEAVRPPRRGIVLPWATPSRDTRAWIVFVIAMPNFFTTALQNSDWLPALAISSSVLAVPVLNHILGRLQGERKVRLPIFLLMITVQTTVAYIPALWLIDYFSAESPSLRVLSITGLSLMIFIGLMASSWGAYFFAQKQLIDLADQLNSGVAHELDLIDQSLWMVRRRWTYVVHGTVQSSLNVAAARLANGNGSSSIEEAIQSLESALASIQSPEQYSRNVKNMLDEIVETWQGVCEFQYQLTPSVLSMLEGKDGPATCLIEISKELVSNANRHGGATKLWLNVYPNNQGDLEVVAGNNGRPIRADAPAGLGVQLFTELTKDFDFEQMKLGGFHATIAMPR